MLQIICFGQFSQTEKKNVSADWNYLIANPYDNAALSGTSSKSFRVWYDHDSRWRKSSTVTSKLSNQVYVDLCLPLKKKKVLLSGSSPL